MDAIVNRLAEIESAAAAIVKHAEEEKDVCLLFYGKTFYGKNLFFCNRKYDMLI